MHHLTGPQLETIRQTAARKEAVTGVPSGFRYLDAMTAGFQPSELVILAARPSMGKTALGLNIAHHVGLKTDKTVGFFSMEMSESQIVNRLLCAEAQIDIQKTRTGYLSDRDFEKLKLAGEALSPGPHLHRRVGGPDHHGDEGQVPPPEDGAAPGHRLRRLHPAHADGRAVREPEPGDVLHLPVAQGAGQGAPHAGRRHLPAQPGPGEGPARAQAHAVRPARVGRHRAGRRRRHLHLPARVLPPGRRVRPGHRRGQRGQAEERPDRRPPAGLHPRVRPFRGHGTVRAGLLNGAAVKDKTVFICQGCGARSPKWLGRCSACGEWNTLVEEIEEETPSAPAASASPRPSRSSTRTSRTSPARGSPSASRTSTRSSAAASSPGSLVLVGGEPGIGKSTLLLQVARDMVGGRRFRALRLGRGVPGADQAPRRPAGRPGRPALPPGRDQPRAHPGPGRAPGAEDPRRRFRSRPSSRPR
ncbi:MAG: hypothetical protein MZU79_05195 [Anaerotruncus sp.]|nr:hypothetical protein [Anaerotruncus sp.]